MRRGEWSPDKIAARSARELEAQRRKHEQYASMMDEVEGDFGSSSDSDSDSETDAPVRRRPVRRRGRGGGAPPAAAGGRGDRAGSGGGAGAGSRAGAGAGGGVGVGPESESEDEAIAKFGVAPSAAVPRPRSPHTILSPSESPVTHKLDPDQLQAVLTTPHALGSPVFRCTVVRNKSGRNMLAPLWSVFRDEDDEFLMCAKKRMGKKTSNYLISMDPAGVDRKSPLVIGKVRANWSGSGYHVFDHGMNPDKSVTDASVRRDLAFVAFDYDAMGPGKMEIGVPRVSAAGIATVVKPRKEEDTVEAMYRARNDTLMYLANKRPKWDETVKGHVLNFNGRVTMSSVKNFQLACEATEDATVLQFGRVGKNRFTMDYQYPLSALQAFGIVLASLDGKLADSKSFQVVKKKLGGDGLLSGLRKKLGGGSERKK